MLKIHKVSGSPFTHSKPAVLKDSAQTQTFSDVKISNGYGNASSVSVSPGYGATISAHIDFTMTSIDEKSFNQVIDEVKRSTSYQTNSSFQQVVNNASYDSAGSSTCGIFGWLTGGHADHYANHSDQHVDNVNSSQSSSGSDDQSVANSVASSLLKNMTKVHVTADIAVTGMLLTPSPTTISVEVTTFTFTDSQGNTSSVSLVDTAAPVPTSKDGTVSKNSIAPGSKLNVVPLG